MLFDSVQNGDGTYHSSSLNSDVSVIIVFGFKKKRFKLIKFGIRCSLEEVLLYGFHLPLPPISRRAYSPIHAHTDKTSWMKLRTLRRAERDALC